MKFRVLAGLLVLVSFCFLTSCTGSFSSPSNGFIFVATQGDSSVTPYAIDLSDGALTELNPVKVQNGSGLPLAMALDSGGDTLFGLNTDGSVWSMAVSNDGSLGSPAFTSQSVGSQPQDIIVDSSGKFVFVANQGNAGDPTSGTVSVFSVSSGSLTLVGSVQVSNDVVPTGTLNPGPSALAIATDNNTEFLYVANTFTSSIATYSVDSSGNLTPINPTPTSVENSVGLSPSGLAVSSDGGFLYVANFGLNSLSGFAICDQARPATCVDVNSPNGSLTALGAPFPVPAGLGPTRMIMNPAGPFVFAVGEQSNQVLSYKQSPGSGALTAAGSISAGTTPTSIATRAGTTINSDDSTQEYLFAVNSGSAAISSYSYTSLNASLNLITNTATQGQPVAIAIK